MWGKGLSDPRVGRRNGGSTSRPSAPGGHSGGAPLHDSSVHWHSLVSTLVRSPARRSVRYFRTWPDEPPPGPRPTGVRVLGEGEVGVVPPGGGGPDPAVVA